MKWHDCKIDPPKDLNHYIVKNCYNEWGEAWYVGDNSWRNVFDKEILPDKWAEVNLDEED